MKILLVAPYTEHVFDTPTEVTDEKNTVEEVREDLYPSAALLHLAAMLRANNYEPVIVDLNNHEVNKQKDKYFEYSEKIIIDSLNKHKPDLVGINCLFSGNFPDVLKFARTIKSHSPNSKIAIGGMHPTTFPKEIITNCDDIDYVAIGEGENAIVALAASIKTKNENLLSSIKSFAYKDKDGVVRINREQNYIDDLNSLPIPAWDLIDHKKFEIDMDNFYNPTDNLIGKFRATIFSSRACPCDCNFCDMFLVMGKKHRKKTIKTIVDEIEYLHKSHGVNYFSFMDDNLTLNRTHIMDLCNEIIRRKLAIIWDTPGGLWVNSLREEIVAKMAEAGLVRANLAIESGDEYIRNKVVKKSLEREKIFEVAGYLKKYKIMSYGGFIMGFPEDTNETLKNTYDMINELQLDKTAVGVAIPLPGTALFKQVVKDKLFVDPPNLDDLWKTPIGVNQSGFVIKPYNMSLDDLHKWRLKFDRLQIKYWKTNPNPATNGRNIKPDSQGRIPRQIYNKRWGKLTQSQL